MAERAYPAMAGRVGRLACGTGWPRELPGAGLRARPELLVVSERLARRGVARGHGLAYDLNE